MTRIVKSAWASIQSFLGVHALALRMIVSSHLIDHLFAVLGRLRIVWPSALSLLLGVVLLTFAQVADLFSRPFEIREYVVLVVFLCVFWIIPLHIGARILLNQHRLPPTSVLPATPAAKTPVQSQLDIWLPRDLGLLAILALSIAVISQARAYGILADRIFDSVKLPTAGWQLYSLPVICLALFWIYLGVREGNKARPQPNPGQSRKVALAFAGISFVFVLAASLMPLFLSDMLGGLLFFPLLVGGWVMPVVAVMVISKQGVRARQITQWAFLFIACAMIYAAFYTGNTFHDIRTVKVAEAKANLPAQVPLQTYIDQWKMFNGCDAIQKQGKRCKAIIVTAEGGASRAAFQVATVMGRMMDSGRWTEYRDKLFLFSGVSGGSLGLATVRQAMEDSTRGQPPCRADLGREGRHWIYYNTLLASAAAQSWRKCLQLLVSGDYLTPTVVGLALRDWWMALPSLVGLRFEDRSALLELAMERHYAAITGKDCGKMEGLCAPFGHHDFSAVSQAARSSGWLPALILNSTLVERGQGVVVSDIDPASSFPSARTCLDNAGRVYPAHMQFTDAMPTAYDFYGLLEAEENGGLPAADDKMVANDIRMSTAIVTSARFPFISSRGNVRNQAEPPKRVGQLVDGGYFDNSGLSAVFDIVDALECNNVDSIVINIRNNPIDDYAKRLWSFPGREMPRQPLLETLDDRIEVAFAPAQTFLNASEGHVLANRYEMTNRIGEENFISANIYKAICLGKAAGDGACLKDDVRLNSVSMSWWLSASLQMFINMQDSDSFPDVPCGPMRCRKDLIAKLNEALDTDVPVIDRSGEGAVVSSNTGNADGADSTTKADVPDGAVVPTSNEGFKGRSNRWDMGLDHIKKSPYTE